MLDIKSKIVLKTLIRQCPGGSYKIVESRDIISSMPNKYKLDLDGLENILIYLERQECISIKYDDDGVYCLCVLPYGYEILEKEQNKKRENNKFPPFWLLSLTMFLITLLSSTMALIFAKFLLKIV